MSEKHPCLCDECLKARDAEIARVRSTMAALVKAGVELRDAWTGPQLSLDISKAKKKQRAWHNFKLELADALEAVRAATGG